MKKIRYTIADDNMWISIKDTVDFLVSEGIIHEKRKPEVLWDFNRLLARDMRDASNHFYSMVVAIKPFDYFVHYAKMRVRLRDVLKSEEGNLLDSSRFLLAIDEGNVERMLPHFQNIHDRMQEVVLCEEIKQQEPV
jgi:hypothetical protein